MYGTDNPVIADMIGKADLLKINIPETQRPILCLPSCSVLTNVVEDDQCSMICLFAMFRVKTRMSAVENIKHSRQNCLTFGVPGRPFGLVDQVG